MVNKAILIGNLGKDPELRSTSGGSYVANLRLATSHRTREGDEWTNATEWHNVVCFGKTAENCAKMCAKGSQLYVEGRIQTRRWEDRDGNDRYTTEVVAHLVRFLRIDDRESDDKTRREDHRYAKDDALRQDDSYGDGYGDF